MVKVNSFTVNGPSVINWVICELILSFSFSIHTDRVPDLAPIEFAEWPAKSLGDLRDGIQVRRASAAGRVLEHRSRV
jgi:hypothetical protein